jgi:hypothetical protein
MSDIYLQITETPTVVTLSAPVISGALSSTVTVANTVTVALDANSLSALENVTVTVGAAITGTVTVGNFPASQAVTFSAVSISNLPATQAVSLASVPTHGVTLTSTTVTVSSLPAISGTVAVQYGYLDFVGGIRDGDGSTFGVDRTFPVTISDPLPAGSNLIGQVQISGQITSNIATGTARIGVVTVGGGTVTIGAGTAQIGSVTASISGTVPISISSVTVGNSVTIASLPALVAGTAQIGSVTASISGTVPVSGTFWQTTQPTSLASLPALAAGTAQIGSVTASISGTVPISISSVTVGNSVTIGSLPAISGTVTANTFALQGTAVTTSNFTSTTASTVLANYNATREVLTIFNEGAGNLHICAGATCTTIAYQVRLSAGDYYEVPNHQTTITHSAVFATAGTARIVQIS